MDMSGKWSTLAATLLSIVLFVAICLLGVALLFFLDGHRGFGENFLLGILSPLVFNIGIPVVAAYATFGMLYTWIEQANINFVFWFFSTFFLAIILPVIIYIGVDTNMVSNDAPRFSIAVASSISPSVGAYLWMKLEGHIR